MGHHRGARKKQDSSTKSVMQRRKKCRCKNTKKRYFQRSLWTRRTKRADASRDASKFPHKIAAVFHVWRHLCTERHMVRQHLLRGTIATEVVSVILRGSEKKTQKTTFSKNTMDTPHKTSWRVTRSVGNSAGNHS